MLIKSKDPSDEAIQQLEKIKHISGLSEETQANVERELKTLVAGNRGEENSAYFIDFYYRHHPNWAIIHDLRIEHNGNIAQIDHLLINRRFEFYVLESKSYAYGVKITERGEFLIWQRDKYRAIESPIEQNKRHIYLLERFLSEENLLPKRLGINIEPSFKPYVIISPKSNVIRPSVKKLNTNVVIKSDELFKQIQADGDNESLVDAFGSLAKLISTETLIEFSKRLVSFHKPASINYYAKFGIETKKENPVSERKQEATDKNYFCAKCGKPVTEKVAMFCFSNKKRFGGKAYCFEHQKLFD